VPPALAGPSHCPPGLAKKNPPCVPPGQARGDDRWRDGDRHGDHRLIEDPRRYGLAPHGGDSRRYYLVRDMPERADPDMRRVLGVIGLARALPD